MEQTTQPQILKVVSVDPGNNLGIAFLEVNLDTCQVVARDATTVVLDKVINKYHPELVDTHDTLLARTFTVNQVVNRYCNAWEPDYIAHETAFSAHGRRGFGNSVESFASLRENILAIKLAAMQYDTGLIIVPINPSTVKYAVAGQKSDDKDQISKALKNLEDLELDCDTRYLDQHGWDAIAIGYTFIKKQILGVPKDEHRKRNKRPKGNKNKATG